MTGKQHRTRRRKVGAEIVCGTRKRGEGREVSFSSVTPTFTLAQFRRFEGVAAMVDKELA